MLRKTPDKHWPDWPLGKYSVLYAELTFKVGGAGVSITFGVGT